MFKWAGSVQAHSGHLAFPLVTYPGLAITGESVNQMACSGDSQFRCIRALTSRFPQMPAIAMSMDLSLEAEAFGARVKFCDHEIPTILGHLLDSTGDIAGLKVPEPGTGRMGEYLKAIKLTHEARLGKPVFGGVIGPFSLAGRLLDMTGIMTALLMEPDEVHLLLEKCTSFIDHYIEKQIDAGVYGIIMAEPAAGLLAPDQCEEFSSVYVKQLVGKYQNRHLLFMLHNCGHTESLVESMVGTGAAALHFGNAVDMGTILPQVPSDRLVLGNLDPVNLIKAGPVEGIRRELQVLKAYTADYPNFIVSSGCDVPPGTPLEHIDAFFMGS